MAVTVIRGPAVEEDEILLSLAAALEKFQASHPHAQIDLYRQYEYIVRIRVIDSCFQGQGLTQRIRTVWQHLQELPDEVVSEVATLLCITPDELPDSIANLDFEQPQPLEPMLV